VFLPIIAVTLVPLIVIDDHDTLCPIVSTPTIIADAE
jgi:hypothetical protein